tara:strand:+ start:2271 stop:3503 length:1233 start_codon:yes stop_codon:yes gene_type:complete
MKKKSPFLNAYSSPGSVSASFAKTNAQPITFSSINEEGVVEGTSDNGGNPTAEKLKKESKVYQPGLNKKLAKAKSRFKEQKIQSKIDRKSIKDEGKATRVKIKKAIPQAKNIKNQNQKTANLIERKASKKEFLIKNKKMEQQDFKGSALKYINPNTLAVQGDAGMQQNNMSGVPAPEQQMPNRAGRPVNSNVLINDPNNYQDPSKMSAQQDSQARMFSGLAQMGNNPNAVMDNNVNNSVMPGDQPSPLNIDTDPPKKGKVTKAKMAYSQKMEKLTPAKSAYPLAQSISLDKKDTVSYEMRPGKTTMENIGTNADGTPNMVPSTTYTKNRISNKDYASRMGDRVDRVKTPLQKKNWIKGAIKKPGQLHKDLGVPQGEKIPKSKLNAAADGKYGKKTQQRANLAKTLSKFKK